jgi:hypothetical protein
LAGKAEHKEVKPVLFPATGEFGHTRCITGMPLSSRDKPGPYEILELVVAGGMGAVTRGGGFRARP